MNRSRGVIAFDNGKSIAATRLSRSLSLRPMPSSDLPELQLGDGDLFGASLVTPAFASDLSTWNITIHKHGLLTQTVALAQPPEFENHIATLRQHVADNELESLKQIAVDERLATFGSFPSICMTDQQQTRQSFACTAIQPFSTRMARTPLQRWATLTLIRQRHSDTVRCGMPSWLFHRSHRTEIDAITIKCTGVAGRAFTEFQVVGRNPVIWVVTLPDG